MLGFNIVPQYQVVTLGSDGALVSYLECVQPPVYLGYISYLAGGTAETCCWHGPSAGVEYLAAYGCPSFNPVRMATPRPIVINPDESCHCISPVPVEETSWGRVKALYRD